MNKYWNIFSTLVTIISLSSLLDSIVKWGYIINIGISTYQQIYYPIIDTISTFLSIKIEDSAKDIYVISLVLSKSLFNVVLREADVRLEWMWEVIGKPNLKEKSRQLLIQNIFIFFIFAPLVAMSWMVIFPLTLIYFFKKIIDIKVKKLDKKHLKYFQLTLEEHIDLNEKIKKYAGKRKFFSKHYKINNEESMKKALLDIEESIKSINKSIAEEKIGRDIDGAYLNKEQRLIVLNSELYTFKERYNSFPYILPEQTLHDLYEILMYKRVREFLTSILHMLYILIFLLLFNYIFYL